RSRSPNRSAETEPPSVRCSPKCTRPAKSRSCRTGNTMLQEREWNVFRHLSEICCGCCLLLPPVVACCHPPPPPLNRGNSSNRATARPQINHPGDAALTFHVKQFWIGSSFNHF